MKTYKKKQGGILRELDVTKTTELTSRELKLYEKCKRNVKEIMRLRTNLKQKKIKNSIKALAEN